MFLRHVPSNLGHPHVVVHVVVQAVVGAMGASKVRSKWTKKVLNQED